MEGKKEQESKERKVVWKPKKSSMGEKEGVGKGIRKSTRDERKIGMITLGGSSRNAWRGRGTSRGRSWARLRKEQAAVL